MSYIGWVTQKSAKGETRTYMCIRATSGKVLAWLGRNPTPEAIRAAITKHDVIVRIATKKEE